MTAMAPPAVPREIRNDKAAILWVFMAVWIFFLAIFTFIAIRDGGIPQVGIWAFPLLGLFWLGGLGAGTWAASHARVHVTFADGGVTVRERWPFRVRERYYPARQLVLPDIVEGKDSDGDPYFTCLLELPDGQRVPVAEGSHRPDIEAARGRLAALLR